MSAVSGKAIDWKLLKRILGYTRPYRSLFTLAITLTVLLSFLSVVRPMLIRYTVNEYVHPSSEGIAPRVHLTEKDSLFAARRFDSLMTAGRKAAAEQRTDEAIALYHQAYLGKKEDSVFVHKVEAAFGSLYAVLPAEKRSADAQSIVARAKDSLNKERIDGALFAYREALLVDPQNAEARAGVTSSEKEASSSLKHLLTLFTLLIFGFLVFESVLQFVNGYSTSLLGQRIVKDMRVQLHRKVIHFRSGYFDQTPIGMLVTRVISDIEAINDVFSQGFIVIAGDLLTIIVYLGAMLFVNWKITLVVLATVPLMFVATWWFKNAVKQSFIDVRNAVAALNTFVQEHITGMKIVQVFNREKTEMGRFRDINGKHRDANVRSVLYYSIFFPVVEILVSISLGLLVWYAGKEIFDGFAEPGDVTLFVLLINQFFRPIRMLADRINTLQMGMVSSERVFKVMDTEEFISDTGTEPVARFRGDIRFQDLWFAYKEENWVLKGISFNVKAGETVAIVGATGSGKSTIINLLSRFYEYNKGEILIDDQSIRSYKLKELRGNIGVVLQDVFLFSDTIYNNITLHNPLISREQVERAAKAVGAHDFITRLPGAYDYNVKERGGTLSVGQRQLIAFIRAYVYDPSILVLDEATSSIDTESEILIQQATNALTKGRTSVVIAHRLATIQKADRILVLDHGEIIESGTHQELLQKGGQYKRLFELQFKQDGVAV